MSSKKNVKSTNETVVAEKKAVSTEQKIDTIMTCMRNLLWEKNRRYGDSALYPLKIFYKGNTNDAILVRLNDKVSRIANSDTVRLNDMCDIIGYCTLFIANNYNDMSECEKDINALID